jgi:hypothetical protein
LPTYLLLYLARMICPDSATLSSLVLRRIAIKSCLCECSLTRVVGSVTLAIDKARKSA